jgi:hypothetical protein
MGDYRLTSSAESDLAEIADYTIENFGIEQARRYRDALEEFHGLSPEQMHHLLNFPFASPQLVHFPEKLDSIPKAPVLTLFELLTGAIGEQGLKPTAKDNLPLKFCREAAQVYWGEQKHRENTQFGGINREDDFLDLHITRLVAELAGLIRKYKGRFILTRDCRSLTGQGWPAKHLPTAIPCLRRAVQLGLLGSPARTSLHPAGFSVHPLCHETAWRYLAAA